MIQEKISKEERERLILKAAKTQFAKKGYYETKIEDILVEANMARGTFYLHFEGKRPVFDAILKAALRSIDENIKIIKIGAHELSPNEQLKANFRRVFEMLVDDPELSQILFYRALGIDDESVEQLNDFYGNIAAMLESAIDHGITLGLLAHCNSHIVSYSILGGIKEVITQLLLKESLNSENIELIVDEILRLYFYGLYLRTV